MLPKLITTLWLPVLTLAFNEISFLHKGCFKDMLDEPDLPFKVTKVITNIKSCVDECKEKYFRFAGLQNGDKCFCGNVYGRYGPSSQCRSRCSSSLDEVCGGPAESSIYYTTVNVPGPPRNLKLKKATENSLMIKWEPPGYTPDGFITDYYIHVSVNDSFDISHNGRTFSPKVIQVTESSRMTNILGLRSGSKYNVQVRAASQYGEGGVTEGQFWTVIGTPEEPEAPILVHHDHDHDEHELEGGEIHVQLKGLRRNRYGPITKYRVLVLDETNPNPFIKDQVFGYAQAKEQELNYWIAGEFPENFFGRDSELVEFVVGDNRTYGGYWNFGPLPSGRDFHVTLGVVSTWNQVTKVSYAKVSHDQHALENIAVFEFHDMHEHDHHHHSPHKKSGSSGDPLSLVLTIIIIIMSILLGLGLAVYAYLRITNYRNKRKSGSRGDIQELTTNIASIDMTLDNDSVQVSKMDYVRSKIWNIPVNFLQLDHKVIGRGKFGSVVAGVVNKYGQAQENVNVQVIPAKIMDDHEVEVLAHEIEYNIGYGTHTNLLNFVGICEDKETIFVVFEQAWPTLKQTLLSARQSSTSFLNIMDIMNQITLGMDHLAKNGIMHKKLCSRNIFFAHNQIPKIGAIGIVDYITNGQEPDMTRWTAPEAFNSGINYVWKCDVWSLAVVFWECITLGATPYSPIPTKEVPLRVMRGIRLPQPSHVSEEFYQLLLTCWQVDLDERPTYEEILDFFQSLEGPPIQQHDSLELYKPDLELKTK